MPELITPDPHRYHDWQAWAQEFADDGTRQDGAGSPPPADTDRAEFNNWITTLQRNADSNTPPPPGYVNSTTWWIEHNNTLVGAITLRHRLTTALLRNGGHIGYSIRPSARQQGLATWALCRVLEIAAQRGMKRVLVTCDDNNVASAKTIERCGGVLENKQTDGHGTLARRYWINLSTRSHVNRGFGNELHRVC